MTYNPERAVITCDTPGCRFRLYTMGHPTAGRWVEVGGATLIGGRHACPHHAYMHAPTERTDQA